MHRVIASFPESLFWGLGRPSTTVLVALYIRHYVLLVLENISFDV